MRSLRALVLPVVAVLLAAPVRPAVAEDAAAADALASWAGHWHVKRSTVRASCAPALASALPDDVEIVLLSPAKGAQGLRMELDGKPGKALGLAFAGEGLVDGQRVVRFARSAGGTSSVVELSVAADGSLVGWSVSTRAAKKGAPACVVVEALTARSGARTYTVEYGPGKRRSVVVIDEVVIPDEADQPAPPLPTPAKPPR